MIDKIVIRSINNSLKLFSRTKFSNYAVKFCTLQSSENFVQAVPRHNKLQNRDDILTKHLENIKFKDKNDLTDLISYMNEFQQSADEKLSYDDIKTSKNFVHMCTIIQRNARSFSTYNILQALQLLFSLNVPNDTVVIETLLQLMRIYINDLTIFEISKLYDLLSSQNKTELTKALLKALQIVFVNQIQIELDPSNRKVLMHALRFGCKINSKNSILYIINMLCRNQQDVNIDEVTSIFYALPYLPILNTSHKLFLTKVNDIIITNYKSLPIGAIRFLLFQILKIMEKNIADDFCFEHLIKALCTAAMDNNSTLGEDIQILTLLNMMQYGNKSFMDHIAKKCIEDPKILTNYSHYQGLNIVKGMNICSYKTIYWDALEPLILNYVMNENLVLSMKAAVTFHLLSLGYYNKQLIEHVFTLYNGKHHDLGDRRTMFYILKIHQFVKTLYPEYQGVTLSQDIVDYIFKHIVTKNTLPLKSYLEQIVKNNIYVKSDMKTKLGHVIDHVIILQRDGSSLTADDYGDSMYVEDIVVPIGCSRIFILAVPVALNRRYSEQEQNTWKTTVASLKTLIDCNIVSINLFKWHTLNEGEKKSYLKKSLKDHLTLHNNVITN
ncbi:uncharacterized protein LOC144470459 [Augochlora pura]